MNQKKAKLIRRVARAESVGMPDVKHIRVLAKPADPLDPFSFPKYRIENDQQSTRASYKTLKRAAKRRAA